MGRLSFLTVPIPIGRGFMPQLEEFFRDCWVPSVVLSIFHKSNFVSHLQVSHLFQGWVNCCSEGKRIGQGHTCSILTQFWPILAFHISPRVPSSSLCGGRWVYSDNISLHRLIQGVSWDGLSTVPSQRGLLGNSVLLLKASLPAEPHSSFWNRSCPVNSIWCSLPGLWLVEQEYFQCICFLIL